MTLSVKYAFGAGVALSLALATTPANAAGDGFTPDGRRDWSATIKSLIPAPDDGNDAMRDRCVGFTEMGGSPAFRAQAYQVPTWALFAHMWTCHAYKTVADGGRNVRADGDTCQSLGLAIKSLDKAKVGVDTDEIVALAGQLKDRLTSLNRDLIEARACGKRH